MPGRGLLSWFPECDDLFVFYRFLQDFCGAVPCAVLDLAEIPGMTLSAREIASGLIDGKVIFRSRKMNRRNEPIPSALFLS
jgi:hypothetical protein